MFYGLPLENIYIIQKMHIKSILRIIIQTIFIITDVYSEEYQGLYVLLNNENKNSHHCSTSNYKNAQKLIEYIWK